MSQVSQIAAEETSPIVVAVSQNPAVVLFDSDKFDAFYAKLKADVDDVPVDLTTRKGRDAIASVAAKVRSEKARIDKDRLRLTKEWRDMTAQVNGAWNSIKDQLDTLAVDARKPLTDWEEAENTRLATCRETIARIKGAALVTIMDTAATVRERGTEIWSIKVDADVFGDMAAEAMAAKEQTVAALKEALARLEREEAEREELEKLRAEAAARVAEEEARRAAEAEKAAAAEAAEREAARVAAAQKAEADHIERAKEEAAKQAQRDAEAAAQKERDRIQREHDEQLAAERRRAEEAERAAQADRDRIAAEKAEAERLAAEQAKRDADKAHRSKIMSATKTAIMSCGADEETAKKIVLTIIAGEIPNVTLRF